ATAAAHSGQLYIAPYVACAIGDYFMYNEGHVLVIFDDLTKHAWAYRQISLLLGRSPGRGSYPGDIFYLHSRLVERAARLNTELGKGTMTHLPIIETLENDLTAYIPTNLVSMTDGQIFVSSLLFNEGFKPAINIGLSVSRVGSKAQWPIIKKLAGPIRLEYIQYNELLNVTKLQASVSKEVKRRLKRGEILVSFITQYKDSPSGTVDLALLLFAYKHDLCVDLSTVDIENFKKNVLAYVKRNDPKLVEAIETQKKLTDEIERTMKITLSDYVKTFPSYLAFKEEQAKAEKEAQEAKETAAREAAEAAKTA
ncbi:MAG: F0F1 ATP synthase subunit alpha, partial [Candidatus Omnitrophica bacterium]|nr:F0F1 ATP synthase subunit alpha [Candidatus Omnitrophota bacterium]